MSNLLLNGTSTVTFYKLKGKITAQTEELLIELQWSVQRESTFTRNVCDYVV